MERGKTRRIIAGLFASMLPIIAAAQTDVLKLRINGNNYSDETIIRFVNGATDNFDGSYDAWKMFSGNPQVPSLYTQIDSLSPLSINALPPLDQKRSVDVYAAVGAAGAYTITPSELAPFQAGLCIMLEDMTSGNYYDMRAGATPSFQLAAGNNNGQPRFRLHFTLPVMFTVSPATCSGNADGEVILAKPGCSGWNYSISDNEGNIIAGNASASYADTVSGLAAGTYTVTAMSPAGCPESSVFTVNAPGPMSPVITCDTLRYLSQASIQFDAVAQGAATYSWDFGDGSPVSAQASVMHTYAADGNYTVMLTVSNGSCTETIARSITVLPDPVVTAIGNTGSSALVMLMEGNTVTVDNIPGEGMSLSVYNMLGQEVAGGRLEGNSGKASMRLGIPGGNYIVSLAGSGQQLHRKVFITGE
jgi:hypothetical protein